MVSCGNAGWREHTWKAQSGCMHSWSCSYKAIVMRLDGIHIFIKGYMTNVDFGDLGWVDCIDELDK